MKELHIGNRHRCSAIRVTGKPGPTLSTYNWGKSTIHREPPCLFLTPADNWEDLNNGLGLVQFYPGISVHPTDPTFLLGGLQDNGTNRRDGPLDWSIRLGGDGGHTALHPATPNIMFGEYQGTGNLFASLDGGENFFRSSSGIDSGDRRCPGRRSWSHEEAPDSSRRPILRSATGAGSRVDPASGCTRFEVAPRGEPHAERPCRLASVAATLTR